MIRSPRSIAAVLILGGVVLGVLLTSGLRWTDATRSESRHLGGSQAEVPPELAALYDFNNAFKKVAAIAQPSVVTITSERVVRPTSRGNIPEDHPFKEFFGDDFFQRFWHGPRGEFRSHGLGSGVIVSEDGYVLTNNHVVHQAEEILVVLADDREFPAAVVGTDPDSDLALLKIDAQDLPVLRFGDSDALDVGEWVIAVGSPFNRNLRQTVTAGIVSAKGRDSVGIVEFEDFIQTDAAINPGNSGGALINLKGELVGVNTAIATRSGAYQGVGFAIPIKMAEAVMHDLLNTGRVIRGWLGVFIQSLDDELAGGLGLDSKNGVVLNDVVEDGPAAKAGLRRGDVVLEFEGVEVRDADHLQGLVAAQDPGAKSRVKIHRDGKQKVINVKLGERPENARQTLLADRRGGAEETELANRLGLAIEPLNESYKQELGYEDETQGLVVTAIRSGSPAAAKNIRRGDLILEINRKKVGSVADLNNALEGVKDGEPVLLLLRREQTTFFTAVKMPAADTGDKR